MVFNWFKRGAAESQPASSAPAEAPPPPEAPPLAEPEAPGQAKPEPAAPEQLEPSASSSPIAASGLAPAPTPAAAPAAVDQDALAWARQAYARLKAQQEAAAPAASPASPESAPIAVAPAQAAPAELAPLAAAAALAESAAPTTALPPTPPAPASSEPPSVAPVAAIAAPSAAPAEPTAAPPAPSAPPAPPAPPEPQAPAAPSLLELAAAQRQQRRQEILAAAAAASPGPVAAVQTASGAPVAPIGQPAASSAPGSASAPTAARPPSAADQAEPSLGAFDAEFTWSAEVLAAQGRRVEEVSLEEIDWLSRLRRGLEKTRKGFVAQLLDTLGDDPLSAENLEALESTLLRADVGVQATDRVLEALRQRLNQEVVDPAEGLRFLKEQLRGILEEPITASGHSLLAPQKDRLNVWLLVGVNGVGKTTTLGKLANLAVRSGYSCLIAAADTFRAAAVQQVSVWGERSGVPVVSNPSANADPAAVVYDAIGAAKAKGTELVLVDTAGRLQTKHNLMEELSKVRRIVDKLAPEAVVESLLVLDSSQGQNGLRQAMAFASAAGLTGVVLTKLDGSARGGVALAVASEAGLPIRFVGAGETIRDLRPFNSFEFVEALLAG